MKKVAVFIFFIIQYLPLFAMDEQYSLESDLMTVGGMGMIIATICPALVMADQTRSVQAEHAAVALGVVGLPSFTLMTYVGYKKLKNRLQKEKQQEELQLYINRFKRNKFLLQ